LPVRQWVLSLPKRLRGFLHRDAALAGKVLRILLEEVERAHRRVLKAFACGVLIDVCSRS
jgi:hypothetical protein